MTTDSLWGDLSSLEEVKVPASYLKEQAEILTQSTRGLLVGDVHQQKEGDQISVELDVVVPALADYRLNLARVLYPLTIYPLDIQDGMSYEWQKCPDEQAFVATLKTILTSPKTRKAMATLLAQSKI